MEWQTLKKKEFAPSFVLTWRDLRLRLMKCLKEPFMMVT
jgi:hypothetical protein